jgi:hypothetical protein
VRADELISLVPKASMPMNPLVSALMSDGVVSTPAFAERRLAEPGFPNAARPFIRQRQKQLIVSRLGFGGDANYFILRDIDPTADGEDGSGGNEFIPTPGRLATFMRAHVLAERARSGNLNSLGATPPATAEQSLRAFSRFCERLTRFKEGPRTFTTNHSWLGLGPLSIAEGDELWLLRGADLAPQASRWYAACDWRNVPTWIHGFGYPRME